MEALAAEWSTRRRASPFVPASRLLQGRSSLDGNDLSAQAAASMNMQLYSRLLEEGGALAMGAAVGAAAATAAEQQPWQYGKSVSMRGSLHRVLKAAVAAVGSPRLSNPLVDVFARCSADGRRRQSAAGSDYVMPPVPMHPAEKVLSMQVRVAVFVFVGWVRGFDYGDVMFMCGQVRDCVMLPVLLHPAERAHLQADWWSLW